MNQQTSHPKITSKLHLTNNRRKSFSKHIFMHSMKLKMLVIFSFIINISFAQPIDNGKNMRQQAITPVMKVTNLKKDEVNPMKIDELKIDIKVLGQIAVTTMEFSYLNSNNRIMEGEFSFPLAEGQTVSRFALDINGQMREGVVVEKEKGRTAFEAVVRKGVDPGLLEKTEGNNFRARVYPLPANGYRRIIITFEQELSDKGEGYLYQLPLKINEAIRNFSVHAEVIKQEVKFRIKENELTNFKFKKWNEVYIADFKEDNFMPDRQLAFMIPYNPEIANFYTERISENNDSSWFYINIKPKPTVKEKTLPKKITIFWDNSNSCQARNIEKEILLLDNYLKKIGDLQVELVPFNIQTEKNTVFTITNGNWPELKKALTDMVYDGATTFGNIDFSMYPCDEILLFSDGLSNFGLSTPKFSKVPVIVLNSNTTANHSFLNYIAQKSGGQYINLTKYTTEEATAMLLRSDYHFISATVIEGNVSGLYPSVPSSFQNSFSQTGIIKGTSAVISLNFGFGNTVVYSEKMTLSTEKETQTGLLRHIWAQKKLADLSIDEEANKELITQLGKQYNIVTTGTSLIVLESLEDYVQHRIIPPADMQNEYFSRINGEEQTKKDQIKNHIDYVAGLFKERIDWWNKEYKIIAPIKNPKATVQFTPPVIVEDDVAGIADTIVTVDYLAADISAKVVEEVAVIGYATERRNEESPSFGYFSGDISQRGNKEETKTASIQLNAWDPQTPYLKVLQYATKGEEYATYLKLKKEYGSTPLFYVDASDFFAKAGQLDIALKTLSNLAELKLEEPQLMRILGIKLQTLKQNGYAVDIFKKVLKIKGEEPQSYRDLALAYEANGQYQLAVNTMYDVVKKEWDGRFPKVELIVLGELNQIIDRYKSQVNCSEMDERLIKNLPVDMRVVLTWDTDNCDMDLWVTDPRGEKCFYSHKNTEIGGMISDDFTGGYGPEEFLLKKAIDGNYSIQANYYGTRSQTLIAPVTLHLAFFTNYGKPNQLKQEVTIRLENKEDVIDIGKFTFKTLSK